MMTWFQFLIFQRILGYRAPLRHVRKKSQSAGTPLCSITHQRTNWFVFSSLSKSNHKWGKNLEVNHQLGATSTVGWQVCGHTSSRKFGSFFSMTEGQRKHGFLLNFCRSWKVEIKGGTWPCGSQESHTSILYAKNSEWEYNIYNIFCSM
jgi:hypothetical protein